MGKSLTIQGVKNKSIDCRQPILLHDVMLLLKRVNRFQMKV